MNTNRTTVFSVSAIIALAATAFAVGTTFAGSAPAHTVRDLSDTPVAATTASAIQAPIVLADVLITATRHSAVKHASTQCTPFASRALTQGPVSQSVRGFCQ